MSTTFPEVSPAMDGVDDILDDIRKQHLLEAKYVDDNPRGELGNGVIGDILDDIRKQQKAKYVDDIQR